MGVLDFLNKWFASYRVTRSHHDDGYEIRTNGERLWLHVVDTEKYKEFTRKQDEELMRLINPPNKPSEE